MFFAHDIADCLHIVKHKQTSECKKPKKKIHQYPENYKTSIAYN